jgi:hypothetical protein
MSLTVNGVAIPEEKIVEEMARLREGYETYVRQSGGEPSEVQLREWAEEDLIEGELIRQEALVTQPEPSEAQALKNIEECPGFYKNIQEGERLAQSKVALRVHSFEKAIRKQVARPDEAELRRYYDERPELFMTSEALRLSHICRRVGPGGTDMPSAYLDLLHLKSELANARLNWFEAIESSDTYRQDYGMFDIVMRGELPPAIEAKLFALETGEVSDVIDFDGSRVHLFRLLVKEPPQKVAFKEVREELSRVLFEQAYQHALEAAIDALKAKAVIERGA